MKPSSHQPESEYSRRERLRNAPSPSDLPRVRARSARPEKYEVQPAPRRVVRAAPADDGDGAVVARRSKNRRHFRFLRRLTMWEWAGGVASLVACMALLPFIVRIEGDFRQLRGQVEEKQTQLTAIDRQKNEEKNRLAHLKSPEGREQLLAERGYLKPGNRILLFPSDSAPNDSEE